jgi:hypothetical protein
LITEVEQAEQLDIVDTSADYQNLFLLACDNLHILSAESGKRGTFLSQADQFTVEVEDGALFTPMALFRIQFS